MRDFGNTNATWIGLTPPPSPIAGQFWWRTDPDQTLYVYYDDGNSQQWVNAVPSTFFGATAGGDLQGTYPSPQVNVGGFFYVDAAGLPGGWSTGNVWTFNVPWKADLLIGCTCSWFGTAGGLSAVAINLDGVALPNDMRMFFNEASSHKSLGAFNIKRSVTAGNHTLGPVHSTNATSDPNDFCRFGVTMVRVP